MEPPPFTKLRSPFLPYLPLIALGVQAIWWIILFIVFIFLIGDTRYTYKKEHGIIADILASPPSIIGLILGLIVIIKAWPASGIGRVCLIIGTMICGIFTAFSVIGLFNE